MNDFYIPCSISALSMFEKRSQTFVYFKVFLHYLFGNILENAFDPVRNCLGKRSSFCQFRLFEPIGRLVHFYGYPRNSRHRELFSEIRQFEH